MLFVVHDEQGRISQANKHYDPKGYDKVLEDVGYKFIALERETFIMPDDYHVENGALRPREAMPIVADRQNMVAGKVGVTLSGLPVPARITVSVMGMMVQDQTVNDGSAYVESPVPGTYTVTIDAFPYLPWSSEIECVA